MYSRQCRSAGSREDRLRATTTCCAESTTASWLAASNGDHPISYLDTPIKTVSKSIEVIMHRRWILFMGFVAHIEDTRLPKCLEFGEVMRGTGCVRGQEKEWMRYLLDYLRTSVSTPTSGRLQPLTRGNDTTWWNKGRNISLRNGLLYSKPGLDDRML
ncbi:unnamed protein product [Ascophyllum nodosum]